MSYARFGWEGSDVYVYLDCRGFLACCGCKLDSKWEYDSTDAMLAHLRHHVNAGHHVPLSCTGRLEEDRDENDAFIAAGGRRGDDDAAA